jgi:hypothetical protein
MTSSVPELTVITDPRRQSTAKIAVDRRMPIRSITNPPIRTMKMFGML